MSRLIDIFLFFIFVIFVFALLNFIVLIFLKLVAFILLHHLLYPSFHHSEVLLWIYVFCLWFILHVVDLSDISLSLFITLQTVVDASWGTRWLVEKRLESEGVCIHAVLAGLWRSRITARENRDGSGVLIEGKVVPSVRS